MPNVSILKASTVVNPDGTFYLPLAKVADKGAYKANLPLPADTVPLMNEDVPSPGTSMTWARADHIHPANTSMLATMKSYVDAQNNALQEQISSLAQNLRFIGQADVVADSTRFTSGSGITPSPGPLPAASSAMTGFYVIVVVAGRPPAGSHMPADDYAMHDWIVCDGVNWQRLDVGATASTASTTSVMPVIDGMDDVQEVLETLYEAMPLPSNVVPLMDGLGSVGTAIEFSREDHKHPSDTSRYAASNPAGYVDPAGAAAAAPVQSVATRTGAVTLTHTDITDWATTLGQYALISSVPQASSTPPAMNGTVAVGTGTTWSRGDHVHPADTSRYAASNPAGYQTAAQVTTTLGSYALTSSVPAASSTAPLASANAAAVGTGTTWARGDHVHPMRPGVTDGSDAPAGQVGEYLNAQVLSTAPIALVTTVDKGIIALSIPAGDWDVWGAVGFTLTGNNSNTVLKGWLNITGAATAPSLDQMGGQSAISAANTITTVILPLTPIRV
jgi:hypothetical protein